MMFVQDLFSTRPWQNLVPDFTHTLVTAGYGNYGQMDYATTGVTDDGSLALAYLPTIRTVTVDLTRMSSAVNAYWYDPTNGLYTVIEGSPFPNTGTYQFAPPGNNSDGDGDWILVLEINLIPTPTTTPTNGPTPTDTPTPTNGPTPTNTPTPTETQTPNRKPIYLPIIKN